MEKIHKMVTRVISRGAEYVAAPGCQSLAGTLLFYSLVNRVQLCWKKCLAKCVKIYFEEKKAPGELRKK